MNGAWPVSLRGVTESLVATPGPDGSWNVAALGLRAGDPVSARTWDVTRTRRNFADRGRGVVQFDRDPERFVEAALGILEVDEPVLDGVDAWVDVRVERVDAGEEAETSWVDWALVPRTTGVSRRTVPSVNRGFNAVIEATVAASRLDVDAFDRSALEARLEYLESVARRCGGREERAAFDRLAELVDRG